MVEWMKREPNRFTKRAIQEYLDDLSWWCCSLDDEAAKDKTSSK